MALVRNSTTELPTRIGTISASGAPPRKSLVFCSGRAMPESLLPARIPSVPVP